MRVLLVALLIVAVVGCGGSPRSPDSDPTGLPLAGPLPSGAPPIGSLRLNELLASNRFGRIDDGGKSSDWIEVHNSGKRPLRLGGYHVTDDLKLLDKWAFPNNRVPAGGYHLVWMSGLGRVSRVSEAIKTADPMTRFETTLVKSGADWRYLADSVDGEGMTKKKTPIGWTAVDFDDSAFAIGPSGFGYGDEDDATKLDSGTTVVLTRHEFTLGELPASESLVLQVNYDDGFAAYLNGTRVAAVNSPDGEPRLDSIANGAHEAGAPERFDLSQHVGLLRLGKNVLAVAGMNNSRRSSDLSLVSALGTFPVVCHANFRLKKSGGTLYLIAPDGNIVDQVRYPRQTADQSLGRIAATNSGWGYFLTPSPGSANVGPQQLRPVTSRLSFDPEPGAFPSGSEVRIHQKSTVAVDVRFTNDGSDPSVSSPLYRGPIKLDETSLFRAAAFVGQEQVGEIVSATYLVGRRPDLPVLSISLKPDDFLDVHLQKSGKGRGSERAAFLELFTSAGRRVVATGFGLRLHGGAGRRGDIETKKSYRAYFRGLYGDTRVDYDIIPEAEVKDFDKLVLRANFNDGHEHGSYIRDQVIRDLQSDMGGLTSSGSWYVLLINSKDHGVYNVVERMDEEFFISHLGPGQYDVIKTGDRVLNGTRKGWSELRDFVRSTDFSDQANFEELSRRIDVEGFTSYVILNFWAQNFDWPHNNWYAARRAPDGRWNFLCWDAEWGLGGGSYGHDIDPYAFIDSGGAYGHSMIRAIFFALIGNPGYCEYYQREVRRHLSGVLSPANALRHLYRHRDAIASDLEHEFQTRGYDPKRWHAQVAEIETYVRNSGEIFQKFTDEYFSYKNSAVSVDRVATIEGVGGRRHVVYRTGEGQLHELVSSEDGSAWSDESIRVPPTAPAAIGRPSIYSLASGERRVLYRGMAGHLHELSAPPKGVEPGLWGHTDLTSLLGQPAASCDPSVVVARGVPHIVYVDHTCKAREFWFEKEWRHHPLPAAPRPAAEVVISYAASALHVTYRTMFGAVCEQTLLLRDAKEGRRKWSHRLIFGSPAKGSPLGFSPADIRHMIFRSAQKWPIREPFVSGVKTVRGREQRIPRSSLVHAWYDGARFWHLDPIGKSASEVLGELDAVYDAKHDRYYFAYRDAAGHIREVTFVAGAKLSEGGWQLTDPTVLAKAPDAVSEPTGMASTRTGARYYVYRGREGHLHELCFDGSWSHRDLSMAAGTPGK